MGEWPRNWAELIRGIGCEMCEAGRPDADRYGIRIYEGKYSDAYLQRADVQRGYTLVIWRGSACQRAHRAGRGRGGRVLG